jgi:hypothetical protein
MCTVHSESGPALYIQHAYSMYMYIFIYTHVFTYGFRNLTYTPFYRKRKTDPREMYLLAHVTQLLNCKG